MLDPRRGLSPEHAIRSHLAGATESCGEAALADEVLETKGTDVKARAAHRMSAACESDVGDKKSAIKTPWGNTFGPGVIYED